MSIHNLDGLHKSEGSFQDRHQSGLVLRLRFFGGFASSSDLQSKALQGLVLSPFLTPAPSRPLCQPPPISGLLQAPKMSSTRTHQGVCAYSFCWKCSVTTGHHASHTQGISSISTSPPSTPSPLPFLTPPDGFLYLSSYHLVSLGMLDSAWLTSVSAIKHRFHRTTASSGLFTEKSPEPRTEPDTLLMTIKSTSYYQTSILTLENIWRGFSWVERRAWYPQEE